MDATFEGSDPTDALKFIRQNRAGFRVFRRVVLEPGRTAVVDINGDALTIEGVGWKTEGIARLLHGMGASFDPSRVNEPPLSGDSKEYEIVRGDPWGQDRDL